MKIQIRKGTFETNSSSTHTIAISREKCDKENVIGVKDYDIYDIWSADSHFSFGRSNSIENSVGRRIAYLVICWLAQKKICDRQERVDFYNKITSIVTKYVDVPDYQPTMIRDVKKKLKNMFQKIEHDRYSWMSDGHEPAYPRINNNNDLFKNDIYFGVDHDDKGKDFVEYVTADDDALERWIIHPDSFVASGGDEYNGFYMKRTGYEYDYDSWKDFKKRADAMANKMNLDVFYKGN